MEHYLVVDWNYDMSEIIGVFDSLDEAEQAVSKWAALPRSAGVQRPAIELWQGDGYTRSWRFDGSVYVEEDLR